MAQFVIARRPLFLWGYGSAYLFVILSAVSASLLEWWGLIPIAFAFFLLLTTRLALFLWATYQRLHLDGASILGYIKQHQLLDPQKNVLYLDLGYRQEVNELATQLVRGRLYVTDLYASHFMPDPNLQRARLYMRALPQLPSLEFVYGRVDLLPVQDKSVHLVIVPYVLKEIIQDGDQHLLFNEIYRVLEENGRILLLEQCRSPMNWICLGFATYSFPKVKILQQMLFSSGLRQIETADYLQLSFATIATRPGVQAARQLPLNLYD